MMNAEEIIKALSNNARWKVLQWLKEPKKHFPDQKADIDQVGVCCGRIQSKLGLSQSTTSHYLKLLEKCGLLVSVRLGQWTFYKRNEKRIQEFTSFINKNL